MVTRHQHHSITSTTGFQYFPTVRTWNRKQRDGTLDAYNNTRRIAHFFLFLTINHQWLNFISEQETAALIRPDRTAYTRSVAYVRIWLQIAEQSIAELAHNKGLQTITLQQIQYRAHLVANQIAASTPQQFTEIINAQNQDVITFYDAIKNLFNLFNELSNQEDNLECPGTQRTILQQVHLEPTSPINEYQRQITESLFNTMQDLILTTSEQYRRIQTTIREQVLENFT